MFQSQLSCQNCEYATKAFVGVYVQTTDSIDVVFQNVGTHELRITSMTEIAAKLPSGTTEEQLDRRINALCEASRQAEEVRVNTWVVPNDFHALVCPSCKKKSIKLELLSII